MKRKLGYWSIVLLTINSIIGTGIFLSPGSVVTKSGSFAPIVYIFAATFAGVLAITFAAAAKYVTNSGAAYAYTKAAFGEGLGFYIGITRYFTGAIAWGVMATGVVKIVLSIFKMDNSNFKLITLGFIILMFILFIINILGTKFLEIVSNISTIGKLLALATTIIAGILVVITTGQNNFSQITSVTGEVIENMNISKFVMAVIAAFYAYTGFESVASGSEDMKSPEKNLPRAIPLAIFLIAIVYTGIVSVGMIIDPVALVQTKETVALIAIFDNPIIKNIILYGALVSMFGINVAASFHTPRIIEAMSNQKQVPKIFSKRTSNDVPIVAMLTTVVLAIVLPIAFNYNMGSIMIISSISRFAQFLIVPLAIITFYYGKQKEKIVENVRKNFMTDVFIPLIGLVLTILLLIKFNWVGQFTIVKDGIASPNYLAIISMTVGFFIVPALLWLYNKNKKV